MQTTSFQGIKPQFAGTKPNSPINARPVQTALPSPKPDSVHFGGNEGDDSVDETSKTNETSKTQDKSERSFWTKSKDGIKQGFKDAFRFRNNGIRRDIAYGAIGGVAMELLFLLTPLKGHALWTIPLMMLFGGVQRFAFGLWDGFKGKK